MTSHLTCERITYQDGCSSAVQSNIMSFGFNRIGFPLWNEFIHDGKRFSVSPKRSYETRTIKFLDRMLAENKIDKIKHYQLCKKVRRECNNFYRSL